MMKLRKMLKDTKGATAIEYGLIAALIAVAAITAMQGLGTQLNSTLTEVTTKMARKPAAKLFSRVKAGGGTLFRRPFLFVSSACRRRRASPSGPEPACCSPEGR